MSVERFTFRSRFPVPAEALYAWHAAPGAFEQLTPPWQRVQVLERSGGLETGARTVVRVWFGPIPKTWVAVHTAHEPGRMFQDTQRSGPFAHWVHTHRFHDLGDGTSELEDEVEYALPLGKLGKLVGGAFARHSLEKLFRHRHEVTRAAVTPGTRDR